MKSARNHTHTEDSENHEPKVTCKSELHECRYTLPQGLLEVPCLRSSIRSRKKNKKDFFTL